MPQVVLFVAPDLLPWCDIHRSLWAIRRPRWAIRRTRWAIHRPRWDIRDSRWAIRRPRWAIRRPRWAIRRPRWAIRDSRWAIRDCRWAIRCPRWAICWWAIRLCPDLRRCLGRGVLSVECGLGSLSSDSTNLCYSRSLSVTRSVCR